MSGAILSGPGPPQPQAARRSAAAPPAPPTPCSAVPTRPLTPHTPGRAQACAKGTSSECAVAWDAVEEISAAADKKRQAAKAEDPLEKFCEDNADADECRVYED